MKKRSVVLCVSLMILLILSVVCALGAAQTLSVNFQAQMLKLVSFLFFFPPVDTEDPSILPEPADYYIGMAAAIMLIVSLMLFILYAAAGYNTKKMQKLLPVSLGFLLVYYAANVWFAAEILYNTVKTGLLFPGIFQLCFTLLCLVCTAVSLLCFAGKTSLFRAARALSYAVIGFHLYRASVMILSFLADKDFRLFYVFPNLLESRSLVYALYEFLFALSVFVFWKNAGEAQNGITERSSAGK